MYFAGEKLYFKLTCVFFLIFLSISVIPAQTRKPAVKKTQGKTTKQSAASQTASKNQSRAKKTAAVREKDSRNTKVSKNSRKASTSKLSAAERRKLDLERRRELEERRRAALEAKRRREQAIREAQARRLAFERSLRTATIENILADNPAGEDLEVRRLAVSALGSHAGTVVVLDPQTGRILTIVNQDWAIRKGFKPCSTIKLVTAVAGLNENLINEEGVVTQKSFPMNLDDALAYSNNGYFQRVGVDLGNQKLISYARALGLGEPTGLNVENETGGRLPFGNNNPRIYSHGDDFEVTPLQLAVMVSALANGGKLVVPQIPRTSVQKASFQGFMKRQLTLPPNALQKVIPGMIGAVEYGTARRGVDSSLQVAGKTGSCIGDGSWVGLFASVAPVENPRLAVVVITRGQSERGRHAAAIAGSIYNGLRSRLIVGGDKTTAKLPLKPQPKIDAKTSAALDDGEDEDTDDNAAVRKGKKGLEPTEAKLPPAVETAPKVVENKESKPAPLFPPVIITNKSDFTRPRVVKNN